MSKGSGMAKRRMSMSGKAAKPSFGRTPKKPEADNLPRKMVGRGRKLAGIKI